MRILTSTMLSVPLTEAQSQLTIGNEFVVCLASPHFIRYHHFRDSHDIAEYLHAVHEEGLMNGFFPTYLCITASKLGESRFIFTVFSNLSETLGEYGIST